MTFKRILMAMSLGGLALASAGCGRSEPAYFSANLLEYHAAKLLPDQVRQSEQADLAALAKDASGGKINSTEAEAKRETIRKQAIQKDTYRQALVNTVAAMFGTPDEPVVLPEMGLNEARVRRAAGPVGLDDYGVSRGLYRQHCSHCHGITGDGLGPTAAFLNPYPRDYRQAKFKFKSTLLGQPPTEHDLVHILQEGIPGTAMPSFKLLTDEEISSLVEYVKYLSLRGRTEILLVNLVKNGDVSGDDPFPSDRATLVDTILKPEGEKWAEAKVLDVATAPPYLFDGKQAGDLKPDAESDPKEKEKFKELKEAKEKALAAGRNLFFTTGGCSKCHGNLALGDGGQVIYDDWSKRDTSYSAQDEAEELALGMLPRRVIQPRNLRQGVYRGGRRPLDIYRRLKMGIEGTPMPAAAQNVSNDEVWFMVDYVLSLPYEPFSENPQPKAPGHVSTPK